jgi:hypothetical protein
MRCNIHVLSVAIVLAWAATLTGCQNQTNAIPISSIEELQNIGNDSDYPLNGNYILTQDIDASVTAMWNNGAGFVPIANGPYDTIINGPYFNGTFDGQGHTISNLTINDSNDYCVGLFAIMGPGNDLKYDLAGSGGHIKNLGLEGGSISGSGNYSCAGGLVGYNKGGTITNCYTTGAVSGGVSGSISGGVGGLIGWCWAGWITNCYATGAVSLLVPGQNISAGGLIGFAPGGPKPATFIISSYWNPDTSGQTAAGWTIDVNYNRAEFVLGVTGETTASMMRQSTFFGWDFTNVWNINEGTSYPFLRTGTELIVTIKPTEAVKSGAQWSINNGKTWNNSGTVLYNMSGGNLTVSFSSVSGWTAPPNQTVAIFPSQTAAATGTYTQ